MIGDIILTDVTKLVVDLRAVDTRLEPGMQVITAKVAYGAQATQQQLAAVDTGAMKNSVGTDFDSDGLGATVGPTVDYAPYVEYGTSRMAGQPFVGPSYELWAPIFVDEMSALGGLVLE